MKEYKENEWITRESYKADSEALETFRKKLEEQVVGSNNEDLGTREGRLTGTALTRKHVEEKK